MSIHQTIVDKLQEVLDEVQELPAGYQYKIRELCSCIETVVSMYEDVQKGIIPEVFKKNTAQHVDAPEPEVQGEPQPVQEVKEEVKPIKNDVLNIPDIEL